MRKSQYKKGKTQVVLEQRRLQIWQDVRGRRLRIHGARVKAADHSRRCTACRGLSGHEEGAVAGSIRGLVGAPSRDSALAAWSGGA